MKSKQLLTTLVVGMKRFYIILCMLFLITSCNSEFCRKRYLAEYEATIADLKCQIERKDSLIRQKDITIAQQDSVIENKYIAYRDFEDKYGYYPVMRKLINILPRLHREADSELKGFGHLPPFHVIEEWMFDFQCCDGYVENLLFDEVPSDEVFDKMAELARESNLNFKKFIVDVGDNGCETNGIVGEGDEGWYGEDDVFVYVEYLIPGIMMKMYEFIRGSAEFRCETHVLDPIH